MAHWLRLAAMAAIIACSSWLSLEALADDEAAMEAVWKQYWMAIAAAGQCEDRKFTGPDYDAMTHVINQKVNYGIGAGPRNHLIDDAKSDVWDRVFKYGCHDQEIESLLALYHKDLEPALH
jgi:hypothetical protein